jgi:hypothetical protein
MSKEQDHNVNNSSGKIKDTYGFRSALFIDVPDYELKSINEGIENMKLNYLNEQITPSTPLMTGDRFKNCLPEDLFKRLEESSPVKSRMSGPHKMSDFGIISCKEVDEDSQLNEEGEKGESKEQILNLQNFSKTKNFKLKTQLITKADEYEEDFFKSESFPQYNNNIPFSPMGLDKFKALKKDSSPLYNYYDGTTEYLSQSFLNEYGKSEDGQFNYMRKNENNPDYMSYNAMYTSNQKQQNFMENNMYFNQQRNFPNPQYQNEFLNNIDYNGETGYVDNNCYSDINNSGKKSSKGDDGICNMKSSDDNYIVEMFGKRGWICESCNNFNYESNSF